MSRIVVLGSSGFLGRSLCQKLLENKTNAKFMIHKKKKNLQKNEFFGNILDKKSLIKVVRDNDIIVNLVGQYDDNLSKFYNININGGLNLIEIAKIKKNIKIIFASSINVYGENCKSPSKETDVPNPRTSYGIGKFLTEQLYEKYSKLYGFDMTILRFSNLYGKNKKSGLIVNLIDSTIKKPVYLSHNGNQQRDFLFVDDAVNGIIQVIKKQPKKFQIFNISSQNKITPKKIITYIESISKNPIFYELKNKKFDEKCIWADNTKSKKIIGFTPKITFETGLKNILDVGV
jgi:nucleoside-diphosphate-sugar epimerase